MANVIYNSSKRDILNGSIDLDTDAIKVMLVTAAYAPNQDAHDKRDDVTNEFSGTGYTAGGEAIASKSVTQDNTDNDRVFDADDVAWANSTITAMGAALVQEPRRGGIGGQADLLHRLRLGPDLPNRQLHDRLENADFENC